MGITISHTASLAPISAASTIIGFVSFGVTVGTFLRVFWGNIQTVMHARREIPDLLGNVKQELYEERDRLRTVCRRRDSHSHSRRHGRDHKTNRILYAAIRNMLQDFKNLERDFLVRKGEHWTSNSNNNNNNGGSYYDDDKSLGGEAGDGKARETGGGRWVRDRGWTDEDDYENTEYKSVNLWDRLVWLRRRAAVLDISMRLSRVQTRRIAGAVGGVAGDTKYLCDRIQDLEERLYGIETRLNNVIGVRRV